MQFLAPPWQQGTSGWSLVGCGISRAVADVSADADPYTGVAVYDSTKNAVGKNGWARIGGTSLSSPLIAAAFALAGGAHGVAYPALTLYNREARFPASLHDVVSGSNGECRKKFVGEGESGCTLSEESKQCLAKPICVAGPLYDGPTGVGTPNGLAAFDPTSEEEARTEESGETQSSAPAQGGPPLEAKPGAAAPRRGGGGRPRRRHPHRQVERARAHHEGDLALNRARPKASQVGFTFTLSNEARVVVTLARRVRVKVRTMTRDRRAHVTVRTVWKPSFKPLTILAPRGRSSRNLSPRKSLAPGSYRLTLAPAHGAARSIVFRVR